MALSDDVLFRFFNDRGYQNIVVAQSDLEPPDLYVLVDGFYERYGSLKDYLASPTDIPAVEAAAPDFSQASVKARNGTLSFSFLKEILRIFGVDGSASASAAGDSSGVEQMRLKEVTIRRADIGAIESALNQGFRSSEIGLDRIEAGLVRVAYEYVYSRSISVDRTDGTSGELKLGANVEAIADAKLEVTGKGNISGTTEYAKDRPAAIAFKTGKVVRTDSGWRIVTVRGAGFAKGPNTVIKPNDYLTIASRTS
ncbi:hypothetical protein [Rhizobium leguminosarum]|uniref:hypothetical protein n=1 Tax=Rhizobium leguminosarum TaxID=384 RepID=UPI000DE4A605|nr:hypothetical protein [Rhizobium leguminosarum]TCA08573.1 hypothetical protein E0H63_07125 [Rhizobium leguminosarum bv. viciae]